MSRERHRQVHPLPGLAVTVALRGALSKSAFSPKKSEEKS